MRLWYETFFENGPVAVRPAQGVSVAVYLTGTSTLATIYDRDDNPVSNPLTTDAQGYVEFRAAGAVYDVVSSRSGTELLRLEVDLRENGNDVDWNNVNITGGTINNVVIGADTPANGTFVDLRHTGELIGGEA